MPVFAIIPQPNPNSEKLAGSIAKNCPDNFIALEDNKGWLVFAKMSAIDLSSKLGVTSGENGAAVIVEVASYFGRAHATVWSWMKLKMETLPGG